MEPLVGVAVINFNRGKMLQRCLISLTVDSGIDDFAVLVNDAGSSDGSRRWLQENLANAGANLLFDPMPQPGCWPAYSYAQAVNRCARWLFERYPSIRYFYPLNNDCYVHPDWLRACVDLFERDEKIGHVGSKVIYGPAKDPPLAYSIQGAGAFFRFVGREWQTRSAHIGKPITLPEANVEYDVDYSGFGMYRRDLFEQFGGLCEDYPPIYWDDPDWGFTLWTHGYRVVYCPKSEIVHDHLSERVLYSEPERQHHFSSQAGAGPNKQKFMAKWAHILRPDGTRSPILPRIVGC